jgi:hypothetical protein
MLLTPPSLYVWLTPDAASGRRGVNQTALFFTVAALRLGGWFSADFRGKKSRQTINGKHRPPADGFLAAHPLACPHCPRHGIVRPEQKTGQPRAWNGDLSLRHSLSATLAGWLAAACAYLTGSARGRCRRGRAGGRARLPALPLAVSCFLCRNSRRHWGWMLISEFTNISQGAPMCSRRYFRSMMNGLVQGKRQGETDRPHHASRACPNPFAVNRPRH